MQKNVQEAPLLIVVLVVLSAAYGMIQSFLIPYKGRASLFKPLILKLQCVCACVCLHMIMSNQIKVHWSGGCREMLVLLAPNSAVECQTSAKIIEKLKTRVCASSCMSVRALCTRTVCPACSTSKAMCWRS